MTKSRGIRPHLARWTDEQVAILVARYPDEKTESIAADLGRSAPAVHGKAVLMGLKKSQQFMDSPASGRTTGAIGEATRFKSGQSPYNKGTHTFSGGAAAIAAQFKPGQIAVNHLPIGSVTVRSDRSGRDRAWVKTAEPNVWRPRAIVAWESINGPIPSGLIVHHRDRNSLNDDPLNLQAMTRKEHADEHRAELIAARAARANFAHEQQIAGRAA